MPPQIIAPAIQEDFIYPKQTQNNEEALGQEGLVFSSVLDKLHSSERKIHPGDESVAVPMMLTRDLWFSQLWSNVKGCGGQKHSVSHVKAGMTLTSEKDFSEKE